MTVGLVQAPVLALVLRPFCLTLLGSHNIAPDDPAETIEYGDKNHEEQEEGL